MNRKMYWIVAILILLIIGVSVFLLSRTTETEPETVYNPLTEAEKKQVEQNIQDAIDKEKQNLPPIAEEDRPQVDDPITEVSDEQTIKRQKKRIYLNTKANHLMKTFSETTIQEKRSSQ